VGSIYISYGLVRRRKLQRSDSRGGCADAGFVVELPAVEMKFGKALGLADRLKARHAVIIGEDELAAGVVAVKRLADGTQQKLAEPELFSYLRMARDV